MEKGKGKISYIKKPFARRSLVCLPAALLALAFLAVSMFLSVQKQGQGDLDVAAWGLSSLIFSIVSLVYGGISFFEKERNYILAKTGIVIGGVLALFWTCMIIVGLMV